MENTLRSGGVFVASDADFDEKGIPKSNSNKPIVVALLSESCGWCHKTVPELIQAAKSKDVVISAVIVGKSPIGAHMMKASKSNGVPSFLLFKNKKYMGKSSGAKKAGEILNFARKN